jgi:hypothetical protein
VLKRAGKHATQLSFGVRCTERIKEMDDTMHYAVAWYSKNQWEKLREISSDSDALEKTYEEWLTHAEHSINQMKSKNILITKMPIDLNELAEWCASKALSHNNMRFFDGQNYLGLIA